MSDKNNDWEQFEDDQFLNTDENIGGIFNQISETPVPKPLKSAEKINQTHFTFQENFKAQQNSQFQHFQPPLSQSSATLYQNNDNSPSLPNHYRIKDAMSTITGQNNPNFTSMPHIMTEPNHSFPSPEPGQSQSSNVLFQNLPQPMQFSQDGAALSRGALSGRSNTIQKKLQQNAQPAKTTSRVLSSLSHDALSEQEILSQLLKPQAIQSSVHSKEANNVEKSNNNLQNNSLQNKNSLTNNTQKKIQEELLLHVPDENDEGEMMCEQEYNQAVINVLIGDPRQNQEKAKKAQKELVKNQLERFQKTREANQRKLQKIKQRLQEQQKAQCTFQPQTKKIKKQPKKIQPQYIFTQPCQNMPSSSKNSKTNTSLKSMRSFDQFLKAQNDHQKRIQAKIKRQQEEQEKRKLDQIIKQELAIDKTSRRIVEQKRKKDAEYRALRKDLSSASPTPNAFQRLYKKKPVDKVKSVLNNNQANEINKQSHRAPSKSAHTISQSASPSASARKYNQRQPDNKQVLSKQNKFAKSPLSMIDQRTASHRIASTTSNLYQDAKRRQKKIQQIASATPLQLRKYKQSSKSSNQIQSATNISSKSKHVIFTRFLKSFKQSLNAVNAINNIFSSPIIKPISSSAISSITLNYMQLQQVLKGMGYMKETNSDSQKQLLDKMWRSLLNKQRKSLTMGQNKLFSSNQNLAMGVKSNDLQIFLQAIQGVIEGQDSSKKVLSQQNQKKSEISQNGLYGCHCFDEEAQQWRYQLSQKQAKKLKIDYSLFALNRRDYLYTMKNSTRMPKQEYSFKPTLVSSSKHILDQNNREGNVVDRLAKAASPSSKVKEMEQQIAIKRDQECTFKPKTLIYKKQKKREVKEEEQQKVDKVKAPQRKNSQTGNRWDSLYSQAKAKKNKIDDLTKKRTDELEAKLEKQCTFKPKIIQSGNNTKRKLENENDASADSSVFFQLSKSQATSIKPISQVKDRDINEFLKRMEKARAKQMAIKQSQAMGWTLDKFMRKKDEDLKKGQNGLKNSINSFKLSVPSPANANSKTFKNKIQKNQKLKGKKQIPSEQNSKSLEQNQNDEKIQENKKKRSQCRKSTKGRNKRVSDSQNQNKHTIPQSYIELTSDDPEQFLSSSQLQINSLTPAVPAGQISNNLLPNDQQDEIQLKLGEIARKSQMGPFKISPIAYQGNNKILVNNTMTPPPPSAKSVNSPENIQLGNQEQQQDTDARVGQSDQPSVGEEYNAYNTTVEEDEEDSKLESPADESQVTPLQPGKQRGNSQANSIESDREPVLFVDVNLGSGVSKRITVFDTDTAQELAQDFSKEHNLDANTKVKLTKLLQSQMNQLLTKIEEGDDDQSESSSDDQVNANVEENAEAEDMKQEDKGEGVHDENKLNLAQNNNEEDKEMQSQHDTSPLFAPSKSIQVENYMSPGGIINPLVNHADSDALLQASPQLNTQPSQGGKISQIKSDMDKNDQGH